MTPVDPSYRLIKLTQNQFAKVDAEDFSWLSQLKWCASRNPNGFYALTGINVYGKKTTMTMHKLVMGLDRQDGRSVDHINHDTLDNRKCNLRIVSHADNMKNMSKRSDNASGYMGVHKPSKRKRFSATIMCEGKSHYIGSFDTALEAAIARDEAAIRLHGEFAALNFPINS